MSSDAGFLEGAPPAGNDPNHIYSGPGWYCQTWDPIEEHFVLQAGPFTTKPDCGAY